MSGVLGRIRNLARSLTYESPFPEDRMSPMWSETPPPDKCKCKWTNHSDEGGWTRTRRDPDCPEHQGH